MNPTLPDIAQWAMAQKLTYLDPMKMHNLFVCMDGVKEAGVEGHFTEFGLALGGSAICIASGLDGGRNFLGFDVFGMIPAPDETDGEGPKQRYDIIRSGRSAGIGGDTYYGYRDDLYETVQRNFDAAHMPVDGTRIRLVPGLFEDTLPALEPFPIAFAHIDCDWYRPVMLCLQTVEARMPVGGIIVLDDYGFWDGCTKAADEFLTSHPLMEMVAHAPHAILVKQAG